MSDDNMPSLFDNSAINSPPKLGISGVGVDVGLGSGGSKGSLRELFPPPPHELMRTEKVKVKK